MRFDKDFDFGTYSKEGLAEFVSKADSIFQKQVTENGMVLCAMDTADIIEYEERFGSVLEAAKDIILQNSEDGTLESGLKILERKSKRNNAPDYVGYLMISRLRN